MEVNTNQKETFQAESTKNLIYYHLLSNASLFCHSDIPKMNSNNNDCCN
jgi:hypothetical protein